MARKRKETQFDFVNSTPKTMRRKKPINVNHLKEIEPITPNQSKVFDAYDEGKNLFLYGCAGTGKTFIAMYLALKEILSGISNYDKLYMVRSLVPTREIGFLPGDHADKSRLYQIPYKNMVEYMFNMPDDPSYDMLYDNLMEQQTISFWSTSFLRGTTLNNSIIIVDECQNLSFHELDSIITRVGKDCKIIFAGDIRQTDLVKSTEKNGILNFMQILEIMDEFVHVEFDVDDIVRSGLVRSYLLSKLKLKPEL